jgi:hypothetical protein
VAVSSPNVRVIYHGDREACDRMRPFAFKQRGILRELMGFQNIQTDKRRVQLDDGSEVRVFSSMGMDWIHIYAPGEGGGYECPDPEYIVIEGWWYNEAVGSWWLGLPEVDKEEYHVYAVMNLNTYEIISVSDSDLDIPIPGEAWERGCYEKVEPTNCSVRNAPFTMYPGESEMVVFKPHVAGLFDENDRRGVVDFRSPWKVETIAGSSNLKVPLNGPYAKNGSVRFGSARKLTVYARRYPTARPFSLDITGIDDTGEEITVSLTIDCGPTSPYFTQTSESFVSVSLVELTSYTWLTTDFNVGSVNLAEAPNYWSRRDTVKLYDILGASEDVPVYHCHETNQYPFGWSVIPNVISSGANGPMYVNFPEAGTAIFPGIKVWGLWRESPSADLSCGIVFEAYRAAYRSTPETNGNCNSCGKTPPEASVSVSPAGSSASRSVVSGFPSLGLTIGGSLSHTMQNPMLVSYACIITMDCWPDFPDGEPLECSACTGTYRRRTNIPPYTVIKSNFTAQQFDAAVKIESGGESEWLWVWASRNIGPASTSANAGEELAGTGIQLNVWYILNFDPPNTHTQIWNLLSATIKPVETVEDNGEDFFKVGGSTTIAQASGLGMPLKATSYANRYSLDYLFGNPGVRSFVDAAGWTTPQEVIGSYIGENSTAGMPRAADAVLKHTDGGYRDYWLNNKIQAVKYTAGKHRVLSVFFMGSGATLKFQLFHSSDSDKLSEMRSMDGDAIKDELTAKAVELYGDTINTDFKPVFRVKAMYIRKQPNGI